MDVTQTSKAMMVPPGIDAASDPSRTKAGQAEKASAPTAAQISDAQKQQSDPNALKQAVEQANKMIRSVNTNLEFTLDEDTEKRVVKVVDTESGELIRQIPSDEMLAIAKGLDAFQSLMIREKA